jgi:hypothetical protein
MSSNTHSDYISYYTNKKYITKANDNLNTGLQDIHERVSLVETSLAISKTLLEIHEKKYVKAANSVRGLGRDVATIFPTIEGIGLDSINTTIVKPIDLTSDFFAIFVLPANASIPDGTKKMIINTLQISQTKLIYIYCMNTNTNTNGFSNSLNCYVVPAAEDVLSLSWVADQQSWLPLSYGGYFINYNL